MTKVIDFDVALVRELFAYSNGHLIWKERPPGHFKSPASCRSWNSQFSGRVAGVEGDRGYILVGVTIDGVERKYKAHRIVWAWHKGAWPDGEIDHEDHDTGNNSIENLQDSSHAANGRNSPMKANNTSGATGVTWHKRASRWLAQITIDGRNKYLGLFDTVDEAAASYRAAATSAGFHPNHGEHKAKQQKQAGQVAA